MGLTLYVGMLRYRERNSVFWFMVCGIVVIYERQFQFKKNPTTPPKKNIKLTTSYPFLIRRHFKSFHLLLLERIKADGISFAGSAQPLLFCAL